MEWLVPTPEKYQEKIEENNKNNRGIGKLNSVFRFFAENKAISGELRNEIKDLDGEEFPYKPDKGRYEGSSEQIMVRGTDQVIFPGRELKPYYSRYWIAHNTGINKQTVREAANILRVLTEDEKWKLIQREEKTAVYCRLNGLNLYKLTKQLFEDELFELDEELEYGLKIFVKYHFQPKTLLEKKDGKLYFTLLRELLLDIKHIYKALERRNNPDEIMAGAAYLGIEDQVAPNLITFQIDEFVRLLEAVHTRYKHKLPSDDEISMDEMEDSLAKMISIAIGYEMRDI